MMKEFGIDGRHGAAGKEDTAASGKTGCNGIRFTRKIVTDDFLPKLA